MSDAESISVVIPTHERPGLLAATLESLRKQTRAIDEILIVDDASNPACVAEVERIAAADPRIHLLKQSEQRGPAAARNVGLDRATGSHVLFLDDDDLIHPRYCEDGLDALRTREGADAVVFAYECFFPAEAQTGHDSVARLFNYRQLTDHPLQLVGHTNPVEAPVLESRPVSAFLRFLIPVHSCLVRRGAIGDLRFPEAIPQGEDTYFWIALAVGGCRFVHDPRVYAFVRRHPGNLTRSRTRYVEEIQACYDALLRDGLLRDDDDALLAHLKLCYFRARSGDRRWLGHLAWLLGSPRLLLHEILFWLGNLRSRRRLLRYYFGQ